MVEKSKNRYGVRYLLREHRARKDASYVRELDQSDICRSWPIARLSAARRESINNECFVPGTFFQILAAGIRREVRTKRVERYEARLAEKN